MGDDILIRYFKQLIEKQNEVKRQKKKKKTQNKVSFITELYLILRKDFVLPSPSDVVDASQPGQV